MSDRATRPFDLAGRVRTDLAVLLSTFALVSAAVPLAGQDTSEPGACVTHEERRADDSGKEGHQMSGGEPTEGYHGIIYGAEVSLASVDSPAGIRWKEPPEVEGVYCGSPAHEAGLRPGDVILTVNGGDARDPGLLKAERAGMEFRLVVRRNGENIQFVVESVPRPPEAR